jgi:uncharacterized protein
MPTRDDAWPDGTPCWADCMVDDVAQAREFYASLFGWQIEDGPPEAGGYLMALKNGRPAAGISSKPPDSEGMPSVWTTYFATSDTDKTTAAVESAGGAILSEPLDVMSFGRMAVASATDGSYFALWQAGEHIGAGVYNEPGALAWNDLHTTGYEGAKAFYSEVFGFTFNEMGDGESMTYSTFALPGAAEGSSVGGMMLDTTKPEDVPNYWLTWFAIDDIDAALAKAADGGATVIFGPDDSPFGRMGAISAPGGETLGLIDLSRTVGEAPGD